MYLAQAPEAHLVECLQQPLQGLAAEWHLELPVPQLFQVQGSFQSPLEDSSHRCLHQGHLEVSQWLLDQALVPEVLLSSVQISRGWPFCVDLCLSPHLQGDFCNHFCHPLALPRGLQALQEAGTGAQGFSP